MTREGIAKRSTNEARRDGPLGIGAPHGTVETGEPTRGTRGRDGGAELRNRWEETWPVLRNRMACQRNNNE